MDELLIFAAWLVVELLLIGTGRAVVSLASFGRWRGEQLGAREGRVHGMAGALSFRRDGRRVITRVGLLLTGVAFYATLAVVLIAWA
jgi:hypothetical protein